MGNMLKFRLSLTFEGLYQHSNGKPTTMKIHYGVLALLFLFSFISSCGESEPYSERGTLSLWLNQSTFYVLRNCEDQQVKIGRIKYSSWDQSEYTVSLLIEDTVVQHLAFLNDTEEKIEEDGVTKNYYQGDLASLSLLSADLKKYNKDTLNVAVVIEGGKVARSSVSVIIVEPGDTVSYADYNDQVLLGVCGMEYWPDFTDDPLVPGEDYDVTFNQTIKHVKAGGRSRITIDVHGGAMKAQSSGHIHELAAIPTIIYDFDYELPNEPFVNHIGGSPEGGFSLAKAKQHLRRNKGANVMTIQDSLASFYPTFRVYCNRVGGEKVVELENCLFSEELGLTDIMSPTKVEIAYWPKE